MKTDLFQSCGHCWVFQICWHIESSTFTASSFRIWNSSSEIPSPPLALFVVMLSKAHLTSHSRMSGSGSVITPSWLFGLWSSFLVQFSCVFLPLLHNIFCFCWVYTISVLYWAHLCMKCSLGISNFLEEITSLSHSVVFLYFFALITEDGFLISPCKLKYTIWYFNQYLPCYTLDIQNLFNSQNWKCAPFYEDPPFFPIPQALSNSLYSPFLSFFIFHT